MKQKFFILSLLLLSFGLMNAQEPVRFSASAPSAVPMDRPFQVVYTVNATGRDFRAPEINNFDVLAGPFTSTSSSIQIINGRQSSSVSVSYTYTLQAQKTGTFTIPSASIFVGNQKYTSNGVSIKVLPADAQPNNSRQQSRGNEGGNASSQSISGDNIFIRTQLSKTNVYEQEAILLTYKLYTLVDVVQCQPKKMVEFSGFMKQDIELPRNKQSNLENLNGKNYITVVLYQCLLYPQHSGTLQIDKWDFDAVVQVRSRATTRSIFDDFFDSYSNVTKHITAPAAKVVVNALPANKPASFNGTVGHFTMDASLSSQNVKANDAVTLRINIAGSGNMKLIPNPPVKLPDGFEQYDPKVNPNFKVTPAGMTGSKSIEYMFIPRHSGAYDIPSAEFSYFDVQDRAYKTLKTPAFHLQVSKGEGGESGPVVGNYVNKEDVKQLAKDIRFIATDNIQLSKDVRPIISKPIGKALYIVLLLIALIVFVVFRKKMIENSDLVMVRNKKANRVAQKRLKIALKLLNQGNKDTFYEEVLKSVWTYLSDKLVIPVASLNKEYVVSELSARGVDAEIIDKFVNILSTCEFARYAPNTGQQEMGNLYDETIEVISKLEEFVKKA